MSCFLLKLSGEYLAGDAPHLDYGVTDALCVSIARIQEKGVGLAAVVGGGNFWRGRDAAGDFNRSKADNMGMLASVMNALALSERMAHYGARARVLTPFVVGGMTEVYNQDNAVSYINQGNLVIFAGGTGQPFFSTDTIAVIRAAEIGADAVLFAKDVPGVCDKDPRKHSDYKLYREITASEMIAQNLTVVDQTAMLLARDTKTRCALFDIAAQNSVYRACTDPDSILELGTIILPE